MKVQILLFTRFEEMDVIGVYQALRMAAGIILASVCTGAMLLGSANLLTGRPATTNHAALEELKAMGARIINARVVDDGDIITAGGITSSLDLGLWLIERFIGGEQALEISKSLEFEQRGPIWKSSQNC